MANVSYLLCCLWLSFCLTYLNAKQHHLKYKNMKQGDYGVVTSLYSTKQTHCLYREIYNKSFCLKKWNNHEAWCNFNCFPSIKIHTILFERFDGMSCQRREQWLFNSWYTLMESLMISRWKRVRWRVRCESALSQNYTHNLLDRSTVMVKHDSGSGVPSDNDFYLVFAPTESNVISGYD